HAPGLLGGDPRRARHFARRRDPVGRRRALPREVPTEVRGAHRGEEDARGREPRHGDGARTLHPRCRHQQGRDDLRRTRRGRHRTGGVVIGDWFTAWPSVIAAIAVIFLPGLAIGFVLRLRGLALWALAPAAGVVVLSVLAIVLGAVGIAWSPLSAG